MYSTVLEIHNLLRWLVVFFAIAIVIDYWMGLFSKRAFKPFDNKLSLFYTITLDVQFLLGLILYFFLSPNVNFQSFDMSNDTSRFTMIEHPLTMLLAIVAAHVGRSMVKKSTIDKAKFQKGAILFTIALVLILSRMPLK